jgi:AmpD protein
VKPLAWSADGSGWLDGVARIDSPNFDRRPVQEKSAGGPEKRQSGRAAVDLLVVHFISLPPGRFSGDAIERLFTNTLDPATHPFFAEISQLRVSSHFLIRRRGRIVQFVDCDLRAWHAGASEFQGRAHCNDFSVGIELEGDEHHPFTMSQYRSLIALTRVLAARYPLRWMAGHSDIAPGRKIDPGPFFDWPHFASGLQGLPISRPFGLNDKTSPTG